MTFEELMGKGGGQLSCNRVASNRAEIHTTGSASNEVKGEGGKEAATYYLHCN